MYVAPVSGCCVKYYIWLNIRADRESATDDILWEMYILHNVARGVISSQYHA